jgi:hypothetical protein
MSDYEHKGWLAGSRVLMLGLSGVIALMPITGCKTGETPAKSTSPGSAPPAEYVVGPQTPEDAKALATMVERVREYADLVTGIERTLPPLPKEATPEQIDKRQRALEKAVRKARASAKPGDILTAEARPVIKRLLAAVFAGPEGKQLKSSIMDENPLPPGAAKLTVNGRYPDALPLTTVPPQVLQRLPKLGRDLEFRFVGDSLILLDVRAHTVADFIEDSLPR